MKRAAFYALQAIVVLMIAGVVAMCSVAHAQEVTDRRAWTTEHKAFAAGALALHAVDWMQTREIARHPDRWQERGLIASRVIGTHPTVGQVDAYMLGSAAAMLTIAHFMPEYRSAFLAGWGIGALAVVVHNHGIGIRIGGAF